MNNYYCVALFKSRCKYCSSGPVNYGFGMNPPYFKDFDANKVMQEWLLKNHKLLNAQSYLKGPPSATKTILYLSRNTYHKKYNPKYHRLMYKENYMAPVIDFWSCKCGKTNWAFNQ